MTLKEVRKQINKLIKEGHGDKKFGYFSHHTAEFVWCDDVRVTKNGGYYERPGTEKKEEVVQLVAKYVR